MNKITIDKTLVLVGMMGCGKSSIGRRLAKKLDVPFKDLDDVIVESENMSITEIFEKKGEKIVQLNINALKAGREFAIEHTPVGRT